MNQVEVAIIQATQAVVDIFGPDMPSIIEISVAGPQGPATLPRSIRIDADIPGIIYEGIAQNNASELEEVWSITRTAYNSTGLRQAQGTAHGVTWTGRTGHTYS